MIATVKAVPPAQFEAWLAYQKQEIAQANAEAKVERAKLDAQTGARTGRKPVEASRSQATTWPPTSPQSPRS